MKAKKANTGAGLSVARQWITLRALCERWAEEKQRVEEQAALGGLSVSEYMRRLALREQGDGRPIVAATDQAMLRELRRVGGLLKHHFVTIQQADLHENISTQMSETLRLLARTIEQIASAFGGTRHDS